MENCIRLVKQLLPGASTHSRSYIHVLQHAIMKWSDRRPTTLNFAKQIIIQNSHIVIWTFA